MKAIAILTLALALTLGVISATTAYLPPLALPDDRLIGLTLNTDAGRKTQPDGTTVPIARDEQAITAELLATLRAAGVQRVRVKEFSLARWTHKGWFLLAVAGLGVGAGLLRRAGRRTATNQDPRGGAALSPWQAAQQIHERMVEVQNQLPVLPDDAARLRLIMTRLGEIQSDLVPVVADARPVLVAQMGLGGYAVFMNHFAAAERQINRAWSAAADGAYAEAAECVGLAVELSRALGALARAGGPAS